MTPEGKFSELSDWEEIRSALSEVAGPGVPDPEMIPWCEKLNALPGVCTLQSCAGHRDGERGTSGHLWLWLAEDEARRFRERAFELARNSLMERVSVIYQPWGQEVVELEFRGSPDNQLEASMTAILGFLEAL